MRKYLLVLVLWLVTVTSISAQDLQKRTEPSAPVITPAPGKVPNSNVIYQALRNVSMGGDNVNINNFVMKRDAGKFTFVSGTFCFLASVNDRVTGAVFVGEGTFDLTPPLPEEKKSLSFLTGTNSIHEEFSTLVLRFTDGSDIEIKKAGNLTKGAGQGVGELKESNEALRTWNKIRYNLHGRILQDVLSERTGGLFYAFIKGRKFTKEMVFAVDPHGVTGGRFPIIAVSPEEVALYTYDLNKSGIWTAFHLENEYKNGRPTGAEINGFIDMKSHKVEVQIDKSAKLNGDAIETFVSLVDGLKVVPLDLFPTLRVSSVTGLDGHALDFIQEDKDHDPNFFVILDKPLAQGQTYSIRTLYGGKDAISNEGGGNYFPIARADWYPNSWFGDYATYDMTYKVPKSLTMASNGEKVSDIKEGDQNITHWISRGEQTVAGFNLGDFKSTSKKLDGMDFEVQAYANAVLPGDLQSLQSQLNRVDPTGVANGMNLDSLNTTSMINKSLAEAEIAVRVYSDYFGKTGFKRVAMTQQTAPNFGQAWPELVYLPIASFMDSTQRHQVYRNFDERGYFKSVAAHEVAHQWWGHTVGWVGYKDQWMGEGFSETSASIYIQRIQKNPQEFIKFWNDQKELMLEKNPEGKRAIDVGPVTLGYRLLNSNAGFDIPRRLIYPKGGYILHMIRMMMWNNSDPKGPENTFKETMHDFLSTYFNKSASTEDFKAMVEKHMTQQMDLDGNHKIDWFFDPYVYGTTLPDYHFESSIGNDAKGVVLNFKLSQKNVDDKFTMLVPIYVEFANGRTVKLGSANVVGNNSISQTVSLGNMKDIPKRVLINYNNDVLCTIDGK